LAKREDAASGAELRRNQRYAVVVGGANLDIKARIAGNTIAATSNPGAALISAGGVGRNIAHNLARLDIPVRLISRVGDDVEGERLLGETARAGVDVSGVVRGRGATGLYSAVLDRKGELVIGVAAMAILEQLTPADLARNRAMIAGAAFLVADCNLSLAGLDWLQTLAAARGIPFLVEPVSAPKALRLKQLLQARRPIHSVTPNLKQIEVLAGRMPRGIAGLRQATDALHESGVAHVLIGMGAKGALLSDASAGRVTRYRIPAAATTAKDVTGGGDALVAGYVAAIMQGKSALDAALFGQAAAGLTVAAEDTVSSGLASGALWRRAAALKRRTEEV
jgi:pseudouridine kinase